MWFVEWWQFMCSGIWTWLMSVFLLLIICGGLSHIFESIIKKK